MRIPHLVLGVFAAHILLATASAQAQTASPGHAAIEKQILANERAINDAFGKGDVKAFHAANVAPDAIGIDPGGVSKVNSPDFDKMMMSIKLQSWSIDAPQYVWVDDNTVLLTYRWTGKGTFNGQAIHSPTWASTVWTNRGGKWLAVFHQETDAMPPPPPPAPAKPAAVPAPAKK